MRPEGFAHLHVGVHEEGRLVTLEFAHGKANEIGSAVLKELEALSRMLREDPNVTTLVSFSRRTSSRGTPIFIAGADVTERVGWSDDRVKEHVSWQRRVLAELRAAPVFHICVVDGVALGWGTEFMLVADYRVAGPGAVFGLPETGLGIVPGAGGTSELWAHVGVAHTLRLGMTGERIDADEALRIGLVQELAADLDAGLDRARELGALVARRSPTAVAAFKQGVLQAVGTPAAEREALEASIYAHCVDTGQAALGRQHFAAIREGKDVPWGPRRAWERD